MKAIGVGPGLFYSLNVCQHNQRIFHFTDKKNKLIVIEMILGDKLRQVKVETRTKFASGIGCCSLARGILVMGLNAKGSRAILVNVDEGELSKRTIHVTPLTICGRKVRLNYAHLCPITEDRAMLYFWGGKGMWYCDVNETSLLVTECNTVMPVDHGYETLPIRLPDGRLLVAGSGSYTTDITFITPTEEPTFERAGTFPEQGRWGVSTVLVKERFVVGFGGRFRTWIGIRMDDLWVFDLKTRRCTGMNNKYMARSACDMDDMDRAFLTVQGDTLYIIGKSPFCYAYSIPLVSLCNLIENWEIRKAFRKALLNQVGPGIRYGEESLRTLLTRL